LVAAGHDLERVMALSPRQMAALGHFADRRQAFEEATHIANLRLAQADKDAVKKHVKDLTNG
jgi:hypothetical protein